MDAVVAATLIESAKLGLQIYLAGMRTAGKTEEEINSIFTDTFARFKQKRPEFLADA